MHELINENNVFIDCVRRMYITSKAKIFVVDDLSFETSDAEETPNSTKGNHKGDIYIIFV